MEENRTIFALDIGTRSVVGVVGTINNGNFTILDYEQEFHDKRAMRDGQIEDIELVSKIVNKVKEKLEERCGEKFTKVSIAAAGRALRTAAGNFKYDLIPNEAISNQLIQYLEYSAIESAQSAFSESSGLEESGSDYYCVGYSVRDYFLDGYRMKNLEGQKGHNAEVNIIAAFLPASVLIGLYAVTARCGLDVDNLTLEPIAAIHAVVPDDVRFLNIALVDIGGGTSDIAISKDGSIVAYDMVTIAGDEITEAIMQHYLTNFATAEKIKLALTSMNNIEFKDILGNQYAISPDEVYDNVKSAIHQLADSISDRILAANGGAPAAVFLVGGGSQVRDLPKLVAERLGMAENRVALGIVNTDNNLILNDEAMFSPTFVTPIGIGVVSSLYRGCDFFSITVNGKRVMLFNHQTIKVIDALVLSGIKPASLIGITAPTLVYLVNGNRKAIKGTTGTPGQLLVNNQPATIETEIKQGDEITAILAENGIAPELSLYDAIELEGINMSNIYSVTINEVPMMDASESVLRGRNVAYMDDIVVVERSKNVEAELLGISVEELPVEMPAEDDDDDSDELPTLAEFGEDFPPVEINKIHPHDIDTETVSLLLAEGAQTGLTFSETKESVHFEEVIADAVTEAPETKSEAPMMFETPVVSEPVAATPIAPVAVEPAPIVAVPSKEPVVVTAPVTEMPVAPVIATPAPTTDVPIVETAPQTLDEYFADEDDEDYYSAADTVIPEDANIAPLGEITIGEKPTLAEIDIMLNGKPVHLVQDKIEEPLILMHLLKFVELDTETPKGYLILQVNGVDAGYATSLNSHDVVTIKWSDEM